MRARLLFRTCPGVSHAALASLLAFAPGVAHAQAFQGTGTTDLGTVTIDGATPGVHNITVDTPRATITWTPSDTGSGGPPIDFLPTGNVVNYVAGAGAINGYTVLNRIIPSDTTRSVAFNGLVNSDAVGSIWFYSPGGLLIGSTARFNVGSLLLSTSDLVVDGGNDFMPVAGQFSVAGVAGSTSAIEIQPGAEIRAETVGQSNYVVAVAPRIQQDGLISVRGSAALVAAESVDFAVDSQGLFNISVTQGTEVSSNTFSHTGETGGPDSAGAGEFRRVYMVAVPKNNAIAMAIQSGGQIGFDVAGAANLDGNTIVLSAGYNVAESGAGNPIVATPAGIGSADLSVARGAYTSNTYVASMTNAAVEDNASGGIPDVAFGSDLSVRAPASATVRANQGTVSVGGALSVTAGDPLFGGGLASIGATTPGAVLDVTGDATVRASHSPASGLAFAGQAEIVANGGNVMIGGSAFVEAVAIASAVSSGPGDSAIGGQALVDALGGGGITIGGFGLILEVTAQGGASGDTTGDVGGQGTGGYARVSVAAPGDTIAVNGGIDILAEGYGGLAGSSGGQGGAGVGGLVELTANGGTIETIGAGIALYAAGIGGSAGAGGNGGGGNVQILADDGTVSTSGDFGIRADASGFGGDASSTPGNAGSGQGGVVIAETRGTAGTIEANVGGGGSGEGSSGIELIAAAIGGHATVSGINGGNATGGSATLLANAQGGSISSHSAETSRLDTSAVGGDSVDGAGGNAVGGQSVVRSFAGNVAFDAGSLEIGADGTGGLGSINFDGNGTSGIAEIELTFGAAMTVQGDLQLSSLARGVSGGAGGGAYGNRAKIKAQGSSLTVNGSASLLADAQAGDSSSGPGGTASGGEAKIAASGGSTVSIGANLLMTSGAIAGGSSDDVGGDAISGEVLIKSQDSQVTSGGTSTFDTTSIAGAGTSSGQLIEGGSYLESVNNGYIALGGAGSATQGNIEVLGAVSGNGGLDLSISAARDVVVEGTIADTGATADVSLRADNLGSGIGTVSFSGGGSVNLSGAASAIDIYHNPTALGSPTDYSGNVTSAELTTIQLIRDAMQLQAINNFLTQNFALSRNIDASTTAGWNAGAGFVPLGTDGMGGFGTGFNGKFDGLGFEIYNLTINRPFDLVGLFGYTAGASIRNVKLIDAKITGASNTGGLVGRANGGTISGVYVSGSITGSTSEIGGIAGHIDSGASIVDSHASADVTVTGGSSAVGGLAGYSAGTILRSWATGDVTLGNGTAVGGLVGQNDGTISRSYATGNVSSGAAVTGIGGLVGVQTFGSIDQSYATGDVSGGSAVGGLAGEISDGAVSNSWASGAVSGSADIGGFVGSNAGTISQSHWDEFSTGQASGVGTNTGTINLLDPVTSDPQQSGALNFAFTEGSHRNLSAGAWITFRGASRPVGAWEAPLRRAGVRTIESAHQLQMVDLDLTGNYRLGHDIDLSETGRAAGVWGSEGFFPIGEPPQPFSGNFEGQGHVLSNLAISRNLTDLGLFSRTIGTIRALGLVDVNVSGGTGFVGALAAHNEGRIEGSFATGVVNGTGSSTGGLVGFNNNLGLITQSYSSAAVTGSNTAGGLAGVNAGTVSFSFANGSVSAPTAGGLIGTNAELAPVDNSYWDTQTSGRAQMCGSDDGVNCLNANGLTTAQSMQAASYTGWQIDTDGTQLMPWRIYEGDTAPLLKAFLRNVPLRPFDYTTTYDTLVPTVPVVPLGYDPGLIFGTATVIGAGANAGTYTLSYGGGLYSNQQGYNLFNSGQTGSLTIQQAALTVTADAASRNYGDANPAFTYTTSGLRGSDLLSGALTSAAGLTSPVGTYAITQGTLANSNYAITYIGADLAVAQRPLAVTAEAVIRNYGDANPALTYVAPGLVNGDTLTGVLATLADGTSPIGTYAINQGTIDNTNYAISFTPANLTVLARPITVTGDALSRLYGDANPALTYTVGGLGLVNSDTLSGSLATGANTLSGIGAYAVTQGSLAASSNYALTYVDGNLDVLARPLTVTADALSRVYGDANPALTFTVGGSGLVNSDTLTGALATSATGTSNVGAYAITLGTLAASPNYAVTYVGANLDVIQRALSVTANPLSRLYGDADPALTYAATGLVNGDVLSGALTSGTNVTSNIGTYAILQGTLDNANYAISYTSASLDVLVRPITITANALSRLYGDANPALTFAVGGLGLVNGDMLSGALTTSATGTSNVGAYTIAQGTLAASTNYAVTYTGANLDVLVRPLTVIADALSRAYGDANPALTYSVGGSGLVNGDTLSGLLATAATGTSNVGAYAITQGTLSASTNYALSYAGANLDVTQRGLSITANPLSRLYGDANPALTFTTGGLGLVNGDTLTGALTTSATGTSNIGAYAISQGTLAASTNYAVTYAGANLDVLVRPITVTADALSRVYGDANPALTFTIGGSGLVNGDTLTGALTTGATETSPEGAYAIGQGTLAASTNYALTYNGADLTVLPCTPANGCASAEVAIEVANQIGGDVQQQTEDSSDEEEDEATEEQKEEANSEASQDPKVVISGVIDTSGVDQQQPVNEPVSGSGNSTLWLSGDQQ